jgi:hypothetical protein
MNDVFWSWLNTFGSDVNSFMFDLTNNQEFLGAILFKFASYVFKPGFFGTSTVHIFQTESSIRTRA